jgi:hypothetical protein
MRNHSTANPSTPIRGGRSRGSLVYEAQFPPSGVALERPRQDAGERTPLHPRFRPTLCSPGTSRTARV